MVKHILSPNIYLRHTTVAYYSLEYYSRRMYGTDSNTDFILILKNNFNEKNLAELQTARQTAARYIYDALGQIAAENRLARYVVVSVPRSKAYATYLPQQLYFVDAVGDAARALPGATDGSRCIERVVNTRTTHLRETGRMTAQGNVTVNDGAAPFAGITGQTCSIKSAMVAGNDVILVDDIYTNDCNVDEDCIEALYHAGAKQVFLYTVARTMRR